MRKLALASVAMAALATPARPRAIAGTVRADATDPKAMVEAINRAFEEFKATNDDALKAKADDGLVQAKLSALEAEITKVTGSLEKAQADLAAAKLGGGAGAQLSPEAAEHAEKFNAWFRKGNEPANMRDLEVQAALTTQSDPDGGFLVPKEMEKTIDRVLGTVSQLRSQSRVINISGTEYKKLVNMAGTGVGWVGEEEARPTTATPTLREIAITAMEIYANPASTQGALDDSAFDVEKWLADEVSIAFAEAEGAAFVNGSGVKKPRGILQYDTVANASYAWGSLGYVATGAAADFAASNKGDNLIDLYYALKAGYRNGAVFLTSDAVMGTIRKFKDGQGNYLFSPPTGPDMPPTLLGKPVVTDDNMPALGANAYPVAFGNFQRGYLIVDRTGVRILRDPFTNKPFVNFYTTKRVGGGVVNFEAIKLLKCATS
jgi:HK97 family phage major capsid protein